MTTSYSSVAVRPEEIPVCIAIGAGNYVEEFNDMREAFLERIKDTKTREKVGETLRLFEKGKDDYLTQSNPYILTKFQSLLPESQVLVARPALENARENDPNFMSDFYVDCGLNLVTMQNKAYEVNPVQAKSLATDLKKIGINLNQDKLIPYSILDLEVSGKSPSGLVFKISKEGKDIAKDVVLNTKDFKWNYLPSNTGLFRACLDGGGDWGADVGDLGNSEVFGMVVVETIGEADKKEFEKLSVEVINFLESQTKARQNLI